MSVILVTNDDGVESPALLPLIREVDGLAGVRRVNALVPEGERSWISKAITRFDEIELGTRQGEAGDPEVLTANAYPADCANLGIHSVFDERPDLVVAGINIGLNHGLAFFLSSGTVGGASEGWVAGLPAVAFSIGDPGRHVEWSRYAWSSEGAAMWQRAASVAADIVQDLLEGGYPRDADLLNVNFPSAVELETPRVITQLARVGYDGLFERNEQDVFSHRFAGIVTREHIDGPSDIETVESGCVSITPVRLAHSLELDQSVRSKLER
jgi:5'-nucleotidase